MLSYETHDELTRLKEELIQNFSHELQTPLALISGFAELMLSGEWGPVASGHIQALSTILSQSKALSARVEDMVSLRTIHADSLKIEEFSLNALIEKSLLDFLKPQHVLLLFLNSLNIAPQM